LFWHRIKRLVRKDGTVSYLGARFEVPYELAGKTVRLVVDPYAERVLGVEDENAVWLGEASALDLLANCQRTRHKPDASTRMPDTPRSGPNRVEQAHQAYHGNQEA